MATIPLSGTNIRLLSDIPFTNDYKHTRWFDSSSDQLSYFNARNVVYSISQMNFQRIEGYNFIAVPESIDNLWNTNYIMFQNASYNNKWFFAFVTKLEYKQRNNTLVHFQIDTLQTWMFDLTFHPSFVVREHCPLWNSDGSPVINTVPEDLNYGSEYVVANVEEYRPFDDLYFLVIVSKKSMHTSGTTSPNSYINSLNGYPQPFCTYVCPFKLDGSTPTSNIPLSPLVGVVVNNMYLSTDSVNNIVSMYITDVLPDFPSYSNGSITFDTDKYEAATIGTAECLYVKNMPQYDEFLYSDGNKYDGFTTVTESKLLMYPYTLTELTDFKGNKVTYKNEYISGQNLTISVRGSLGINNKVVYEVADYRTGPIADSSIRTMVAMDNALIHDNPNDVPVMVDSLAAYIQGNRNSLQNSKNHILFNATMDTIQGVAGIGVGIATDNPLLAGGSAFHAAKGLGNSIFEMQGLQAKQQDISNHPPSLVKQGANTNFDYGNGYNGLWIIKKEIYGEYRTKLTAFFNAYGYKLNTIKIPNLHTRENWNYVQTKACNIVGSLNNDDLQDVKNIFDNGITLWHTDDMMNYSLSNGVI